MKIRTGFVSNSSSSSFVCVVCHREASGMDLGLSECEMTKCVDGHIFCDDHMKDSKKKMTLKDKQMRGLKWLEEIGEDDEDILEGVKSGDKDWIEDTYQNALDDGASGRYEWPKENCPCCQLIIPTDQDIIRYVCYLEGYSRDILIKAMKKNFGTLDEMDKEIGVEK